MKFLRERKKEIAKMHHLETQELVNGIYVIKTKDANFYVIKDGNNYIAIDAGGGNKNIAANQLNKLNIDPEKITAVLLTHSDFDHTSALSLFKNAAIYLSKPEVQIIDGSVPRMFGISVRNKLNVDHVIESDEELHFGTLKIKPILTPGHTSGSMSYLLDDKYLFVGDALSLKNGQVELFNTLFNMDDDLHRQSLTHLAKMPDIKYIFTAHYGFTPNSGDTFQNFQ